MSEIIQVLQFRLTRLHLDQDPFQEWGITPKEFSIETHYDILSNKEAPERYLMILRVQDVTPARQSQDKPPLFDVTGMAEFEVPASLSEEQKYKLVAFNGGSILYGLIRGQLSMVSGAFPSGALLLPTLDWQEVVADIEKKRSAEIAASPPGPVSGKAEPAKPKKKRKIQD
jgi:hypothetical protein